jgi:azurin
MKNLRMLTVGIVLGLALVLSACGGGGSASGGGAASSGPLTIDIASDGENLAFDKKTLTAAPGQQVTVKFKNNSAAQQHNWVLVKGGDAAAKAIADGGITAGAAADFLPADKANVLAHTKVANGGETVEIGFTAPEAGTYQYICTVPGHYPLMVGTLTVAP